ncbi:neurocalcin homolog [Crassostrea virginica]|uniref:Neurocalcin homolog n=1 Tax=Crassostrea virginica TaxID=6565 RepID=A0A8B8ESA5_CRAVI|nr:neurocalcin homolog [Crassostrea virginica]XP_022342797.1 neurocalcin homolog [Crassostrea virginica]
MGKPNSKLAPKELSDLNLQTNFSEEELQQWYKGFIKECPNGSLTMPEFKKIYSDFFPRGDATSFAEYVFNAFDENQDGTLDFREFMCALSVSTRGSLDQKIQFAFRIYDIDGDGFISKQEMLEIIRAIHKMVESSMKSEQSKLAPEERTNVIFKRMDKNADDKLSLEEFMNGVKEDQSIVSFLQGDG